MKKLFFCLTLLYFSQLVFSQTTFNRIEHYLSPNNNSADFFENIVSYNGYYYGTLALYDSINTPYTGITKLDYYGNLISKTTLKLQKGTIVTYQNQTLIITSDSNLMICSNLVDSSWDGYLIKLDTNLDTLWTKVYDLPANLASCTTGTNTINFFTAIKETPDRGFFIAGNYYKYCVNNQANQRGFLLKVDSAGNVQWWKAYQNVANLYDIELTDDNGYVVINKFINNYFTKLDSTGNIEWQIISDTYTGGWTVTMDITPCGNNEFIAAKTYGNSLEYNGLHVYKINISSHQIIWDTTYNLFHDVDCLSLHKVMGVEVSATGDIIVWATAHINPAPYVGAKRGAILKLNAQGDSLWAKYFDAPNITWSDDLQLNDLIITPDGGYMGVGYQRFNSGKVMAWLFKTDSNGTIGWESSIPLSVPSLKAYPNPATNYTTINIGKALNHESEIIIYNSVGQIVKTLILQKQQQEIEVNVQGFTAGLYFFELCAGDGVVGTGKFVVE